VAPGAPEQYAPRARYLMLFPIVSLVLNYGSAVGVAQLVERRTVAPNVAGSIPVSHPNYTEF
jgi:hypothetical protein